MAILALLFGVLLILTVCIDTFETVILPRSVSRPLRLVRFLLDAMYAVTFGIARHIKSHSRREAWLSAVGPLTLVVLVSIWALMLMLGFAFVLWGLHVHMNIHDESFGSYLYMSGVTIFTLGYGDVVSVDPLGRTVSVIEAGVGFGLLAVVISYLPVLYQSFSKREATILLLDARAGSPPVASELLGRHLEELEDLRELLAEFERWSASMLETYLSYPLLAFYRSQHERLTWLGALAVMLDTCSLLSLGFESEKAGQRRLQSQAQLTYAIARHLIVDLAYILNAYPVESPYERMRDEDWGRLRARLGPSGLGLQLDQNARARLEEKRKEYEPYLFGLARHLLLLIPPFTNEDGELDNWQKSAWDGKSHF